MRLGCATVIAARVDANFAPRWRGRGGQVPGPQMPPMTMVTPEPRPAGHVTGQVTTHAADFTLQIAPMMVELAPQVVISTIGYSNKVPGPLLRMRDGQRVTIEVVNDTDVPEYVHWHGLFVPSDVDGAAEEGTPPVSPHGHRHYQFVATPAGSRWYHSHTESMMDLHQGSIPASSAF